jgi:hypothetical protein
MGLMSLATVGRPSNGAPQKKGNGHSGSESKAATPGGGGKPPEEEIKAINAGSLQRLVDFIPVESITLFWLAIPFAKGLAKLAAESAEEKRDAAGAIAGGAGGDLAKSAPWNWELTVYFAVMFLTPLFLMLVYFKRKSQKVGKEKPPFPSYKEWPWWRAVAAMIAFAAWGLAVPGSTIIRESDVSTMGMWVLAFVISTLLSLLEPIMLTWVFPSQNPDQA